MGNNRTMLRPYVGDVRGVPLNDHKCERWWLDGVVHRDDGPAIIFKDGTRVWYQHGKIHRENGPAIEHPDGGTEWSQNNRLHRTDGPAVEYPTGLRYWFVNGFLINGYRHFQKVSNCPDSLISFLKIKYGEINNK